MDSMLRVLPVLLLAAACDDRQSPAAGVAPAPEPMLEIRQDAPGLSGNNAYAHCAAICSLGPRPTGSPAYARQIAYLRSQLERAGWAVQERVFKLTDGSTMTNLHATFGEASASRPLLLTCHIDTKQNIPGFIGADDGASAAALLVELARVLAKAPAQAAFVEIVFFDGEESFHGRMNRGNSLYGSRYEVIRRKTYDILPKWQINLDMVGGRDKMIAVPVLDTPEDMLQHYLEAVESLGYSASEWTIAPTSYLDDHTPFADAGVATLNLIADFQSGGWWHTAKDDMQRISARSLEESGHVVLRLIERLYAQHHTAP